MFHLGKHGTTGSSHLPQLNPMFSCHVRSRLLGEVGVDPPHLAPNRSKSQRETSPLTSKLPTDSIAIKSEFRRKIAERMRLRRMRANKIEALLLR